MATLMVYKINKKNAYRKSSGKSRVEYRSGQIRQIFAGIFFYLNFLTYMYLLNVQKQIKLTLKNILAKLKQNW